MKQRILIQTLALTLLVLGSTSCRTVVTDPVIHEADFSEPIRVACVGDSITYGMKIENRDVNSYPAQLGAMLGSAWDVRNFGFSSATLLKKGDRPYWNVEPYQKALAFKPHVVIIKLGTNDSKAHNCTHLDDFVTDYLALIESFETLETSPTIWVCLPVPAFPAGYGIHDFVITHGIIPKTRQAAAQAQLQTIDLYQALSGHGDLFPDKIHPNAEGAKIIAQTVYQRLTGREVLKEDVISSNIEVTSSD